MTKQRIAIIGGGLMGHGIAQAFAAAGHRVAIQEPDAGRRAAILGHIRRNLQILGEDTAAADLIDPREALVDAVADADIVIEAVPEDLALKQRVLAAVEAAAPAHALLASNTSVIPITRIMEPLGDKTRAMGTHWWNPPHLIPLVEVIQTGDTGDAAIAAMIGLLASIGKKPVHVRKDVPGFIGNRLQHAMWREAIALVENGVCDAETVDTVVKASFGRRLAVLGPLENADLVGTDLTLAVHEHLLADLDRSAGPQNLLRDLVASGRLGMKAGAGFRTWTEAQRQEVADGLAAHLRRLDGVDRN
ncbi:3-hydroxyacyl-CoA dehydrogenase NAD-binding domain-containing protein [Azospirillum sp. BE72]|uniref:3-hydroxyacyl-CoA dehydrogenase family protein n=1 Tax=Azospirillum sp. BE72 TaxID=2817776 RepID=UPI002857363C|nr:3-hydroxyacyl-CoA dehydrogenase NAD-binding domain-containing protein [Azospirillum sp. BE72]MDR6773212.1 3-hydroxybutyryl-CoA dehydrogenase [Azospirillum sp. BE72]